MGAGAVEGLADGGGGEDGIVVGPRQVVEHDAAEALAQELGDPLGGIGVGQVPVPPGDPLFQGPRVGTAPQHVEVVVGLEDEQIEIGESSPGELAAAPEVGDVPDAPAAAVLDDESDRLAGVVGDEERLDLEPGDLDGPSGLEPLDVRHHVRRQLAPLEGPGGRPDLDLVAQREPAGAADVVFVLVGQHHGGDGLGVHADQFHPPLELPTRKPGIDENPHPARLDDDRIPPTPRAQNHDPKRNFL